MEDRFVGQGHGRRLETVREDHAERFGLPFGDTPLGDLLGWGGLRGQRSAWPGRRSSIDGAERWRRRRRSDCADDGAIAPGFGVYLVHP